MEELEKILKLITLYPWQAGMVLLTILAIVLLIMEHLVKIVSILKSKTNK